MHFLLEADDLGRLRFAFSPMWETIMSLRVLQDPALGALHLPWIHETRRQFAARAPSPHLTLVMRLVHAQQYMPDFLTPPPTTPFPEFEEELEAVRTTSANVIRRELLKTFPSAPHRPGLVQALMDDPGAHLDPLVQAIRGYWQQHLAPHWPRIRLMLQEDVTVRGQVLALGGAPALFLGLHASLTYRNLVLTRQSESEETVRVGGRGLVLVPSLFSWSQVLAVRDAPWQPTIIYPARGAANLWRPPVDPHRALGHLLGASRSRIFWSLQRPSTTQELAARFGSAPGGISVQLSKLRWAGLIEGRRVGRAVYYMLSSRGEALLALFIQE